MVRQRSAKPLFPGSNPGDASRKENPFLMERIFYYSIVNYPLEFFNESREDTLKYEYIKTALIFVYVFPLYVFLRFFLGKSWDFYLSGFVRQEKALF